MSSFQLYQKSNAALDKMFPKMRMMDNITLLA